MNRDARAYAATVLTRVVHGGKSLDAALAGAASAFTDDRDRAFAHELAYGVLRWYWKLQPRLAALLRKPLRARDRDVEMLLLTGLYQLDYLATPHHAAVSATVEGCASLGKAWARGLVNGVLRNAVRESQATAAPPSVARDTAHPEWLTAALARDWPDDYRALLDANNARPPFCLRVNRRLVSRDDYLARLHAAGLDASATPCAESGIRLTEGVAVTRLPGFADGLVSVQDEAAQLAAGLLELDGVSRVLDACAAPGGKAAHLLESAGPDVHLTAIDNVAERCTRMSEGFARLGLDANVVVADAARSDEWWDGEPFDRILLDAPCSGTGVIRRHPDIKLHRRADDLPALVATQSRLLAGLWPLLRPGGKLVYATCSVLKAENDTVIANFLAQTRDAECDSIPGRWGLQSDHGRQIRTGEGDMDGFYYARLTRMRAPACT